MKQRMDACKEAYLEEFDFLAQQFEIVKTELEKLTEEKKNLQATIEH